MKRLFAITAALSIAVFSAQSWAGGNAAAGQKTAQPCEACHGKGGHSTTPQYPILAGQYADYIVQALTEYKAKTRVNAIMNGMAQGLSKQDMENVAAYFSSQKGGVMQIQEHPMH